MLAEKRKELARTEKRLGKVQEYLVSCPKILFMTCASRVVSDIPIVIRIDFLFVEFKSVKPSPEPHKGTSESLGSSKASTLTMKSKPVKASILPGTNEIPVHTAEVP